MADFDKVSGDINYEFSFSTKTGDVSWEFAIIYDSGSSSQFEAPTLSQYVPNELGNSYSADQSNLYLALGDPESGLVDVYLNPNYLFNTTGEPLSPNSSFIKSNRLYGSGIDSISGFGDKVKLVNGFALVGAPNSNDNSGAVFGFYNYLPGGGGATGSNSWGQQLVITGPQESGFFGSAVNAIKNTSLHLVAASATGENEGSGAAYLYDNDGASFLSKVEPSLSNVSKFGRSLQFLKAQDVWHMCIGFEHGGTGKVDIYKESNPDLYDFTFSQTIESPNAHDGDMFGYAVEGDNNYFIVGAPLELGMGAAYYYEYNLESGIFAQQQRIVPADLALDDSFGKNVCFDLENGIITSDKDSGKGYIYYKEGNSWSHISEVSGSNNTISGTFGGNISGSHSTTFLGEILTIGSSAESGTYYFTTGGSEEDIATGVCFSGAAGKFYDKDGHFIYGYSPNEIHTINGSISTGHYNIIIQDYVCNSYITKPNIPLNGWKISGEDNLNSYRFSMINVGEEGGSVSDY